MPELRVRTLASIDEIGPAQWDRLANPPDQPFDPFVGHGFLSALEASNCVGEATGWTSLHLLAEDNAGRARGAMPLYLKNHSQGEYVFDHGWAAAYEQAGGAYYPKLQSSVPFTPVSGGRLLAPELATKQVLVQALEQITNRLACSSAHITFTNAADSEVLGNSGWIQRDGLQFHFPNPGYRDYQDFLSTLTSRKRKALRAERRKANRGVEIHAVSGSDLQDQHWDAFYRFYQDTGLRKWGTPYLNREFFDRMHQIMADQVLLVLARQDGNWIAGALNFIGGDCLFGRYWGCLETRDSLHFELCYHQAIEQAIARKLPRVEAGAQGAHKIARGYLPVPTNSFHYLADPGFAEAVQRFLNEESAAIKHELAACAAISPYRQSVT